jgi:hypothetical protein
MGWIARRDGLAALSTAISMVNLFLLFYLAYRLCQKARSRQLWVLLFLGAFLFAAVNFFTFNITSTDMYDYVARGRITGILAGNPYVQVPNDFPEDALVQLAAWRDSTSAYGPLWEVLSGLISTAAGDWLWASVIAYKTVALLGYLGSVVLIAIILRSVAPERALSGTLLFAWNPLVLLEGIANAHNDMLMIALLLAGLWALCLATRLPEKGPAYLYQALAIVLLAMAVLIKFVPILLLPIFLLAILAEEKTWRRRFGIGLLVLLPAALILFVYYRMLWSWPEVLSTFIGRLGLFRMSLASATRELLLGLIGRSVSQFIATWFFLAAFALAYLFVVIRTAYALYPRALPTTGADSPTLLHRFRRFLRPRAPAQIWYASLYACLLILVLYLLLGSLWFWPWYLIWPIALLALTGDESWILPLILVATIGQLSHVLWNFVWYWMGISWGTLYQVDILVVAFMIVPATGVYLWRRRAVQPGSLTGELDS